jgi:hypothetical protein
MAVKDETVEVLRAILDELREIRGELNLNRERSFATAAVNVLGSIEEAMLKRSN